MKLHSLPIVLLALCLTFAAPRPGRAAEPTIAQLTAAATKGDPEAQYRLACAHLAGKGVPKDPEKAFEWIKKAAAQDYPDAIGGVGHFHAAGIAVAKDEKQAIEWFRKGAEKGSAKARMNLGLSLANGRGVPKDEAEGLKLIDAAAATGNPHALYAQGETYFYGQFGRSQDYPKALAAFKVAAEAGHVTGQNNLGVMYQQGHGTAVDKKAALVWFRKAAEQGNAKAQSNLGHLLGAEQDNPEGLMWVTLAARQKEATAIVTLDEKRHHRPKEVAAALAAAEEFEKKHLDSTK